MTTEKNPNVEALISAHPELVDQWKTLDNKLHRINNRQTQLREILKERAFFPKNSNYFERYETEYEELYFRKLKLTKQINAILDEILADEIAQLRADKKN